MPIDNELTMKLQQRLSDTTRETGDDFLKKQPEHIPSPCRAPVVVREDNSFKAPIDEELMAKLSRRQKTIQCQENGSVVPSNLSTPDKHGQGNKENGFQAPIDPELVKKLQKRQVELKQKEVLGEDTTVKENSVAGTMYEAKIDSELAQKLRNRSKTIQKQESDGFVVDERNTPEVNSEDEREALESLVASGEGPELVQKLARRRHVVELEGDHYQKNCEGGVEVRRKVNEVASVEKINESDAVDEATETPKSETLISPRGNRRTCSYWKLLLLACLIPLLAFIVAMLTVDSWPQDLQQHEAYSSSILVLKSSRDWMQQNEFYAAVTFSAGKLQDWVQQQEFYTAAILSASNLRDWVQQHEVYTAAILEASSWQEWILQHEVYAALILKLQR
eukprot:TRINITY_DN26311_c0_g1_i1.p1 TRINITY_DN26311_c0_g1~~TRINITY_DN26311_c0_g1_i1.p1  ORF type:complete len:392 (+),score=82.21 TRINITY_DN26311_c0_g1_i1:95-1270(+)